MDFNAAPHQQATRSNWSTDLFDPVLTLAADFKSFCRLSLSVFALTHFNVAIHAVAREGEGARHHKSASVGGNRLKNERNAQVFRQRVGRFSCGPRPLR